jgi:hypothetical protein
VPLDIDDGMVWDVRPGQMGELGVSATVVVDLRASTTLVVDSSWYVELEAALVSLRTELFRHLT